jgi:hypothetical protein
MKKIVSLSLVIILILSLTSVSNASTTLQNNGNKSALQEQLNQITNSHPGMSAQIANKADQGKIAMKFETVSDFENAIDTLKIISDGSATLVESTQTESVATEMMASVTYYQKTLTKDYTVYLSNVNVGKLRDKIKVKYYFNTDFQRYRFSSIISQSSYPSAGYFSWVQDSASNNIIDSQRTVASSIDGHGTITVQVGPFPVNFVFEYSPYYEFGYTLL